MAMPVLHGDQGRTDWAGDRVRCACQYQVLADSDDTLATEHDDTFHTAERCTALTRGCGWCEADLVRRIKEPRGDWLKRKFCCLSCSAKRAASRAATYEDLSWLMDAGTPIYEALRRCNVPTAEAAYQWAMRHGARDLARRIRPAYNAEIAFRHRSQRSLPRVRG